MDYEKLPIDEREKRFFFGIESGIAMCANCEHFHVHYVRHEYGFAMIASGHCGHPRLKSREAYDVCERFTPKESKPKRRVVYVYGAGNH